ncbi:helix-hairpin-helix domain-containing protein [Herbaspirillum sp. LeCh32-8]|uniref:helix-hairpin-helix domain-containing protein n=1 Tax=Herbaspirillum sp. LeCh32-8 TaxID=2821356 RepID=UPI001AE30E75|nr:helix-hairpin-helix domain-containing protein [Herbaspirillum sp. LeCh32-8]MBP0600747.1 helix-hairpin-helix domain-containing protein [Herbaspirillum sp. LeCh32-8]
MSKSLFTAAGMSISLGRELGRGGEAAVFEVPSANDQVAKVYHKAPDKQKQSKLRYMASTADTELLSYIAWPQATLHSSPNGPVVGFLMKKVTNKEPIHMFYSPAHRRQAHPKAAWDFLIYVSRNVAASFEVVHSHGFAIGDVNQDSFLVGSDSKVSLIDSDSFQINANNELHLCEVGVPLYTPPELQGKPFHGVARTANHDNFGLALLIFHVLFGGRHPFAGVPQMKGAGDALETDIEHFRYAYARDFKSRGLAPPPRSIPLSILPPSMEAMFVQAFTEPGMRAGRPTASQWVSALDGLRNGLKKCSASRMHLYPNHSSSCPWCDLEKQGVVYFVDLGAEFVSTASGFVLAQVWGLIQSIPVPSQVNAPSPASFTCKPQPLPSNITTKRTVVGYRLSALVVAVVFMFAVPKLWFAGLLLFAVSWVAAGSAGGAARVAEKERRSSIRKQAQAEYEQLTQILRGEAGPEMFVGKKSELTKIRDELQNLPQLETKAVEELKHTAYERQKHKFLDRCFIDSATISGVGPARKAALRSFGIETAADVTKQRVMQVRGFGDSLTRAVLDWKASCERRFTFNPANAVSTADKDAVLNKFRLRKVLLEKNMMAGPAELKRLYERAQHRRGELMPQLEQAAKRLAQASADLALLA